MECWVGIAETRVKSIWSSRIYELNF